MTPTRPLLVALIILAIPAVGRADFPDADYSDHISIRLRAIGLNPFPIYSRTADQGVIGLNDGKVYWGGDARVFMPRGYVKESFDRTADGRRKFVKAEGWQSNLRVAPERGMTFVNVGPSVVRAETAMLRRGDYVTYDGSKFVRGTFRAPDRVRIEPEDTNRELAADLLTQARVRLALNQGDKARATLEELTRSYPDTKSASDAVKLLARLDPTVPTGRSVVAATPPTDLGSWADEDGRTGEQIAADLLALGRVKAALGQYDGARAALRKLMERYPGGKSAEVAMRMIESMPADVQAQVRR